jgi:hypothetical protein
MIYLLSVLFLVVGLVVGWLGAERYLAFMQHIEHDFEELFDKNPHPEIFDEDGEVDRGDYLTMVFDPGFDPDDWDPDNDIIRP